MTWCTYGTQQVVAVVVRVADVIDLGCDERADVESELALAVVARHDPFTNVSWYAAPISPGAHCAAAAYGLVGLSNSW